MNNSFRQAFAEMADPLRTFKALASVGRQLQATKGNTPLSADELKWLRELHAAGREAVEQLTGALNQIDGIQIQRDKLVLKDKRRQRQLAK